MNNLDNDIGRFERSLQTTLTQNDFERVSRICKAVAEQTFVETRERQRKKIDGLKERSQRERNTICKDRWVTNLSGRNQSQAEEEVLRLGLNFTPTPRKIPYVDIAMLIELAARKLPPEEAEDLRGKVCATLKRARRMPWQNINRSQREAIRNLRKDENIMVLPADKGNTTFDSDHGRVVRIFVCAFPKNGTAPGSRRERSSNGIQQRDKSAHISTTKVSFSTNFICSGQYMIVITAV